jgi:probable rRNA maturation factor
MISVALLDARAMAAMNREHLGHRGATDVISFGFVASEQGGVVGDIYICPAVARANAKANRVGVREELLRLVIHGVLHVLGHDHPVDERRQHSAMWKRQERLLQRVLNQRA